MSRHEKNEKWISDFLIPHLINNQKLLPCPNPSSEQFKLKMYDIKSMSHEVAFMLTFCYNVKIVLQTHLNIENGSNEQETVFDIVVKITPALDDDTYKMMNFRELFANEIVAYEFVLPTLGWSSKYPKFYYSHNERSNAALALSDFTRDGWSMSKMPVNLSIDHVLTAVEELGRFHGQLYALKYADTARFDSIKTRLIESRYFDRGTNKEWDLYLKLGVKRALQSARKSTETIVPDAFLQRLQHVLADPFAYQRKCVQPSEPMAVVCHGDFLRSNIAFRYDDSGKATDAMLFDFQTLRYASPMIDLCTFMANSTWQEVRNKYFAEIFGAYHRTLTKHLLVTANWTESDIPDHLKYDYFLREYALFMPFGLSISASFMPMLHTPKCVYDNTEETVDDITREAMYRGGEAVDVELGAQVIDIFRLYEKLDLTLTEM